MRAHGFVSLMAASCYIYQPQTVQSSANGYLSIINIQSRGQTFCVGGGEKRPHTIV